MLRNINAEKYKSIHLTVWQAAGHAGSGLHGEKGLMNVSWLASLFFASESERVCRGAVCYIFGVRVGIALQVPNVRAVLFDGAVAGEFV